MKANNFESFLREKWLQEGKNPSCRLVLSARLKNKMNQTENFSNLAEGFKNFGPKLKPIDRFVENVSILPGSSNFFKKPRTLP